MPKDDGMNGLIPGLSSGFETISLYGGEVTLFYHDGLHAYWTELPDGTRVLVPGVTTITAMIDKSGPLVQWAANSAVEYIRDSLSLAAFSENSGFDRLHEVYPWIKAKQVIPIETEGSETPSFNIPADELAKILVDARFAHRNISKAATDVGHMAHAWLEAYLSFLIDGNASASNGSLQAFIKTGQVKIPDDEKARNAIKAALDWMIKHKLKPLAAERKIYSRLYNYSGTEDMEGILVGCGNEECCPYTGEVHFIGDFKTSKSLYEEYRLQVAAYHQARLEEDPEFGEKVGARVLLRIGKDDGEFETKIILQTQFEMDTEGFLSCLGMYNWAKQHDLINKGFKAEAKAIKASKTTKGKKPRKILIPDCLMPAHEPIPIGV